MSGAGNSAGRQASALRRKARGGPVRRLLARVGVDTVDHTLIGQAARWEHGGKAEEATLAMLAPLRAYGWEILPDRLLPDGRGEANLDDVLVTDGGIVVLDVKAWERSQTTTLTRGRVCCGLEDRHGQVEKVAGYASRVARLVGLPADRVWPLLVVHGSRVAGGELAVRAPGWDGLVYVMGSARLVPRLLGAPKVVDARRAAVVAGRVDSVLRPYGEGG